MSNFFNEQRIITLTEEDISNFGLENYYMQMFDNGDTTNRLNLLITYFGVMNLKGSTYLNDVIKILIEENVGITKIYYVVGKKFKTAGSSVERNIRSMKEKIWNIQAKSSINFKKFVFGSLVCKESITNTEFLYALAKFLSTEFKIEKKDIKILSDSANLVCTYANDSIQVSNVKKEELTLFYWILGKLSANLGFFVKEKIYYISISVNRVENGGILLVAKEMKKEDIGFGSLYYVHNETILKKVFELLNNTNGYSVDISDPLTSFSVNLL